jgi:hypothetical protein
VLSADSEIEALLLASQIWSSVSPHAGRLTDVFTHILHSSSFSSLSSSASNAADTVALQIAAAASVLSSAGNTHTCV